VRPGTHRSLGALITLKSGPRQGEATGDEEGSTDYHSVNVPGTRRAFRRRSCTWYAVTRTLAAAGKL
jgi:hypothetical protein